MDGGEQRRELSALRTAEEHRSSRPRRVEHDTKMFDQHLRRRKVLWRQPIREPDAASIERDHASEAGQSSQPRRFLRVLPLEVEMADLSRDEDDVVSTSPERLEGDVDAVGRARVMDVRTLHQPLTPSGVRR